MERAEGKKHTKSKHLLLTIGNKNASAQQI